MSKLWISVIALWPVIATCQINGLSFEGPPKAVEQTVFKDMKSTAGANWVSLHPYAYGREDQAVLFWQSIEWQWWGEGIEGTRQSIRMAKAEGMQVMVKPHIWLRKGTYTGHLKFENNADWVRFENDYRDYVLAYARLAAEEKADLFCLGNELGAFTSERPAFWHKLIAEVRAIYRGPLTYAANWDDFGKCPFWRELDFMGVNAYFPLSGKNTPDVSALERAWQKTFSLLRKASQLAEKPVLFTEYGYRSIDACCRAPWDSAVQLPINQASQANALRALFNTFWGQSWFGGGFLWKWHAPGQHHYDDHTGQYTVQGKKALEIVRSQYQGL